MTRDKVIDGYRGIAVMAVVLGHAANFRYAGVLPHRLEQLTGPLTLIGVQLFFVISGFIITSLLLREEAKAGAVSIPAFYARRTFRILPPFLLMIAVAQVSTLDKLYAGTFQCNIHQCAWGVAHSWSLAVEEQFYLAWPVLFVLLRRHRIAFLVATLAVLLAIFAVRPFVYQANALSFACIATGALLAVWPELQPRGRWLPWLIAGAVLVLGPFVVGDKWTQILTPLLVAYLLFGARDLLLVRRVLESRPFQWVGLVSYSLYLWQQPFFEKQSTLPIWLLPVVVLGSVFLVERPFNRVGHKLSAWLQRPKSEPTALGNPALPRQ